MASSPTLSRWPAPWPGHARGVMAERIVIERLSGERLGVARDDSFRTDVDTNLQLASDSTRRQPTVEAMRH
jgi:hypothetical protein